MLRNVTGAREKHIDSISKAQRKQEDRTEALVERMLTSMRSGVDFTANDFMFVATMGQPDDYPEEQATLRTMDALLLGEVVGVFREEKLRAIGVTAAKPLTMEVWDSSNMNAFINFSVSSRRSLEDPRHPAIDVELKPEPVAIRVLGVGMRSSWGDHRAFYQPHTVVAGAEAALGAIVPEDVLGYKQAAFLLNYLAQQIPPQEVADPRIIW